VLEGKRIVELARRTAPHEMEGEELAPPGRGALVHSSSARRLERYSPSSETPPPLHRSVPPTRRVERKVGRLKNGWELSPLRVRGLIAFGCTPIC
jgi:hypothetical protein